jgi:hypothetical protein
MRFNSCDSLTSWRNDGLGVVQTRTPSEFAGKLMFSKKSDADSGAAVSRNISQGTVRMIHNLKW